MSDETDGNSLKQAQEDVAELEKIMLECEEALSIAKRWLAALEFMRDAQ